MVAQNDTLIPDEPFEEIPDEDPDLQGIESEAGARDHGALAGGHDLARCEGRGGGRAHASLPDASRYIDDIILRREDSDFDSDFDEVWFHLTDASFTTVAIMMGLDE